MSMKQTMCEFVHGMTCEEVCKFVGSIVHCRDCKLFDDHYLKCFRPVLYFDNNNNPHWTDETTFVAVTDATPNGFCAWGAHTAGDAR